MSSLLYMYMTEGSLEDSAIYQRFDSNKVITTKMISFLKNGVKLDSSYIQEQYIQIKRSRISPLADQVMEAFDNGLIQLIYAKDVKLTTALPFVIRKDNNKIVATIFISNFTALSRDGKAITIPMKNLYGLMESAYVALYIQTNPGMIQRNMGLMKTLNSIYTSMLVKIINQQFSLSLDKDLYDDVGFVISKFFLENIWEQKNSDIVYNYAAGTALSPNHQELKRVNDLYDEMDIKDIVDMLGFLKTLSPRLEPLTIRYTIERYMNTYNQDSVLSLDYLPYVFFVVINVLLGTSLVKQTTLSEIIKNTKGINMFYAELAKIV